MLDYMLTKVELKHLPLNIKKKVFLYFSINNGTSNIIVTQELTYRAICHVLVLALLANNFEVDTSLLTKSIRVRGERGLTT